MGLYCCGTVFFLSFAAVDMVGGTFEVGQRLAGMQGGGRE